MTKELYSKAITRVFVDALHEKERREKAEIEKLKVKEEEKEEKPVVNFYTNNFHNVVDDFRILSCAGIGLPQEEVYRIALAMNQLREDKKLKKVRFFGKIFGSIRNYYICQSEYIETSTPMEFKPPKKQMQIFAKPKKSEDEGGEEKKEPPVDPASLPSEEGGVGTNKNTYWVCNSIGDQWTQLPNVTPLQIARAKYIHKQFSGNLHTPIKSYPEFPGNEDSLLRAQISRIVAATSICPAGLLAEFKEEDENAAKSKPENEYKFSDEFAEVPIAEGAEGALSLEKWVHFHEPIQEFGRCTKYKPPKPKKAEGEEDNAEEDAPEEIKKLTPIKEDVAIPYPITRQKKKPVGEGAEGDEPATAGGGR